VASFTCRLGRCADDVGLNALLGGCTKIGDVPHDHSFRRRGFACAQRKLHKTPAKSTRNLEIRATFGKPYFDWAGRENVVCVTEYFRSGII